MMTTTLLPPAIPIALFKGKLDVVPVAMTLPWDGIVRRLTVHEERQGKDGRLWSPVIYRPNATRSNQGVERVTALVFDVDHAEPDWSLLEGYEYVAYTTFRHRDDDPRWRITVALTEPVPAEEWPEIGARARVALCPNADEACKDAARMFYTPSCPPGAPHFTRRGEGAAVNPLALPPLPVEVPTAAVAVPVSAASSDGGRPGDDYAARAPWADLLTPHGWVHESTHGDEQRWRRPGKRKGEGVSATIGHKGRDILYVFSSSVPPFQAQRGYSKFHVYALLEHDGDFKAAASALAALGYGEQRQELEVDLSRTVDAATGEISDREPIKESAKRKAESPYITADALMREVFPEPRYAVPGLLPEGVGILAGKPKMGKSFLALSLAIAVASGTTALGKIKCEAGDVLYLALEDGRRRLQRRMVDMLGDTPPPARLTFATVWPALDDGGLSQIEQWVDAHSEGRLIIVDTFARVKPEEKRTGSIYSQDYKSIAPITDLAHERHISAVLVMHLRKQKSDDNDPMDLISGSAGLPGAADGFIIMKRARDSNDALLYVIDRDRENRELAISWDMGNGGWILRGPAEDYRRSTERNAILEVLYAGGPATPRQVAERLNKEPAPVKSLMWKMLQDRQVANMGGSYMPLAPRPIAPIQ